MHNQLAAMGPRLAGTREVPLSQTETKSRDLFRHLQAEDSESTQPL